MDVRDGTALNGNITLQQDPLRRHNGPSVDARCIVEDAELLGFASGVDYDPSKLKRLEDPQHCTARPSKSISPFQKNPTSGQLLDPAFFFLSHPNSSARGCQA